jgi:hypothetical protein
LARETSKREPGRERRRVHNSGEVLMMVDNRLTGLRQQSRQQTQHRTIAAVGSRERASRVGWPGLSSGQRRSNSGSGLFRATHK